MTILAYLMTAAGALIAGLSGMLYLSQETNDKLRIELNAAESRYVTCDNRLQNIAEDTKSDASVDDPRNFDVPDGWFLPEAPAP